MRGARGRQFVLLLAFIAVHVDSAHINRSLGPERLELVKPGADGIPGRRQLRDSDDGPPLRLLHINDIHARLDPTTIHFTPCDSDGDACFGGFPRLHTAVAAARAAAPGDVLLLHAGDQFFGTLYDVAYTARGDHIHHLFLNNLSLDAFVPGSHEFDYGTDVLAMFLDLLDAPALACNVETIYPWLRPLLRRFVVIELPRSGVKVGIVGFVPPTTAVISNPGLGVQFKAADAVADGCVADARDAGADVVIALTHLGYDADLELAVGGLFDAVVGGGSHSFLHTGPILPLLDNPLLEEPADVEGPYPTLVKARERENRVPVATAYWGDRYLGQLDTTILPGGRGLAVVQQSSGPVLLGGRDSTNPIESNSDVKKAISALRGRVRQLGTRLVGTSAVPLDGESEVCARETRLGNLVADAILWYVQTHTSILDKYAATPVAAFINGGAIRASLPVGPITAADVSATLPFGNTVVVKLTTAAVLRGALANGVSKVPRDYAAGRFPQVASTLQFSFLTTIPDGDDQINAVRVLSSTRRTFDLVWMAPTDPVLIITSSFLGVNGGDGYAMLPPETTLLDTSVTLDEAVAEYISFKRLVAPRVEKRIQYCGETPTAPLCMRMRPTPRPSPPPPYRTPPFWMLRRPPPPPPGYYEAGSPSQYREQEEALAVFKPIFPSPPPPPRAPKWQEVESKVDEAVPPPPGRRLPSPPPLARAPETPGVRAPPPPPNSEGGGSGGSGLQMLATPEENPEQPPPPLPAARPPPPPPITAPGGIRTPPPPPQKINKMCHLFALIFLPHPSMLPTSTPAPPLQLPLK